MTDESRTGETKGVSIGDIEGGIHDAVIAGRDVIIYEGIKPVSVGDLLDACQTQVQSVLYDVRRKYNPNLYVNRAIERALNGFFDAPLSGPGPNCFLIVAPAGSGKTNLLCELARVRVPGQPVLLLMGGNTYLSGSSGMLGAIQSELQAANSRIQFRSAEDSLHTLHRQAEELDQDALLIVDAINEHDRPGQMKKALEDLLRKTRGKRVKLVITCRDYYWGLFKGRFWEDAIVNDLPAEADEEDGADDFSRFALDEHEQALNLYLAHYQIVGRPVGDAAEQCRHPLLLRFLCEAYRGQEIGEVEDIRLKELSDQYWSQKLDSIAERMIQQGDERLQDGLATEVGDYLLDVASHMLHHRVRAIPLADMSQATGREEQFNDPRSVYGRIRDEFIILEEQELGQRKVRQVAFAYEAFMEYAMARSLLRDWDFPLRDEARVMVEVKKLKPRGKSFSQILGVIVYLSLMLRDDWGLLIWPLLVREGKIWKDAAFEAIRKLPEEYIDEGFFDAVSEMLADGTPTVKKDVIDVLKVRRFGQAAPESVVKTVSEYAQHEQESYRRRAILAMGYMRAVNLTLPVLLDKKENDARPSVRKNAETALHRALESAALVHRKSTAYLCEALSNPDARVRRFAVSMLGEPGDAPAVELLIATLRESDASVRGSAAETLGKLGDARAVEPLVAALKDDRDYVRSQAAQLLGELGATRAVGPLVDALRDRSAPVRAGAAEALGKLGDAGVVELLIAVLNDSDSAVRGSAAWSLGKLGGVGGAKPLIDRLEDSAASVRACAAWSLGELGGAEAVEPLIGALKDSDAPVRAGATEALGKLGDGRAVEPLIDALEDNDMWVRAQAARSLGGRALAQIAKQKELLEGIDPTFPVQAQLAEAQVNTAAQAAQAGERVEAKDAEWMKDRLENASRLLNGILEGAKTAAEKVGDVVEAAAPIAEKLEPLLQSLGVAAAMVAKLWLTS